MTTALLTLAGGGGAALVAWFAGRLLSLLKVQRRREHLRARLRG